MDYSSPSIIVKAGQLLREPLPTIPHEIIEHLIAIDALKYEVAETRVEWLRLLHDKRAQYLWPKEKDKTELDRKTFLDAQTSIIEKDLELLEDIQDLIIARVALGDLLIKTQNLGT